MTRRPDRNGDNQRVVDIFLPRRGGRLWTYKLPDWGDHARPGLVIQAPFGRQVLTGIVASAPRSLSDADIDPAALKSIQRMSSDGLIPTDLWQTLEWCSRYYLISCARLLEHTISFNGWRIENDGDTGLLIHADEKRRSDINWQYCIVPGAEPDLRSPKARAAWDRLRQGPVQLSDLADIYADPRRPLRDWMARSWLTRAEPEDLRSAGPPPVLTTEQDQAVAALSGSQGTHLLEGITGSGKTEVYIELARQTLSAGRNVLVLVPEIALCGRIAERFADALDAPVGIWHSALAGGARAVGFNIAWRDSPSVLVGARSALFAPLDSPGLIVVDEAHDSGYVYGEGIHLNGRNAAIQRGRYAAATVVLGTATPDMEIAAAARGGRMSHVRLRQRIGTAKLPQAAVVDLEDPIERGPASWLSKSLHDAIRDTLARNEQVVLFRNRRAFHPAVTCTNCGNAQRCPTCDCDLSLHAKPVELRCHICGRSEPWQEACRTCDVTGTLKPVGTGTQRIATELESIFPGARIDRLDRDQVTSASRVHGILDRLAAGETDILVGTQMVAKGLDVANVTLVGIVNIDGAIHMADFRSSERAFQLICQVSGRAGRGTRPGHVLVQTRHPNHPTILAGLTQDFDLFYDREINARQATRLPPFGSLGRVLWSGPDRNAIMDLARRTVRDYGKDIRILGPALAPLERARGDWRIHALGKAETAEPLRRWLIDTRNASGQVRCEIQVDPTSIY